MPALANTASSRTEPLGKRCNHGLAGVGRGLCVLEAKILYSVANRVPRGLRLFLSVRVE